ncbi:hypothetical protein GCM10008949_49260 [Deinococcus humi]|nr:hypothetical protein GCM10008949_49260 [Deinococcus humi]
MFGHLTGTSGGCHQKIQEWAQFWTQQQLSLSGRCRVVRQMYRHAHSLEKTYTKKRVVFPVASYTHSVHDLVPVEP